MNARRDEELEARVQRILEQRAAEVDRVSDRLDGPRLRAASAQRGGGYRTAGQALAAAAAVAAIAVGAVVVSRHDGGPSPVEPGGTPPPSVVTYRATQSGPPSSVPPSPLPSSVPSSAQPSTTPARPQRPTTASATQPRTSSAVPPRRSQPSTSRLSRSGVSARPSGTTSVVLSSRSTPTASGATGANRPVRVSVGTTTAGVSGGATKSR